MRSIPSLAKAVAMGAIALGAALAQAQPWPSKPIRIVGSGAPGGANSILANVLMEPLKEALGTTFYFENKSGAGGILAAQTVVSSPPDGNTVMLTTAGTHGILPALYNKLPFDVVDDFVPIARLASVPLVIYANNEQPYKSIQELVRYAKERPGQVTYGTLGIGTSTQLAATLIAKHVGIEIRDIPFKGSAPIITAVRGGVVSLGVDYLSGVMPQIQAGAVRPLAVTGLQRWPELPNVPTVAETVMPGFEVSSWWGFVLRKGTPQSIVDKFSAGVAATMARPDVQMKIRQFGAEPAYLAPAPFAAYIDLELRKWPPAVAAANIPKKDN